ncbi:MAG: transporter permease [Symbiobacteriaceae bacterium]|jgi:ABC-2 type transport system permease protein|nr:transporter permease [Symbiobacteriaceae bacterium]
MRPYLTLFRIQLLALLQYRAAALAKLGPPLFVGLVQVMFFTAFYRGRSAGLPMSLSQTITYCWIVQLLVSIQPWTGDPEVLRVIRTGQIAYELCRPMDLYFHWFSRLAARRLVPLVTSSIPLGLIAAFLTPAEYRLGGPASVGAAVACGVALVGAVLMSAALSNILGIITVWTISGEGIYFLAPVIFVVLSGAAVPLPLFPRALQGVIQFLPFRGLLDTPAQAYLGLAAPGQVALLVGIQLLWTVGFVLVGRLLLARALRSATIQGG